MKLYVMVLLMLFLPTAYAEVSTSNLNDSQRAELEAQAALMRKQNAEVKIAPISTVKQAAEWVDLGTNIGKGLGGAARELGVAVNEFAATPVGQLTMLLVVFKIAGGPIIHILGGLLVLLVGFLFAWFMVRRVANTTITYDNKNFDIFKRSVKLRVERGRLSENWSAAVYVWLAMIVIISIIVIFTW